MNNNEYCTFDIETGPLAREHVDQFAPKYKDFIPPGEFDPASVAVGNLKDPLKIAEKIESERSKHEAKKLTARSDYERDRQKHFDDHYARAALSAITGQVLAIGIKPAGKESHLILSDGTEAGETALLKEFWAIIAKAQMSAFRRFIGHNIAGFDLPFLMQRSWVRGVAVPEGIFDQDRFLSRIFIDIQKKFTCGVHGQFVSLDTVARVLGIPGKDLIDCDGASFAAEYLSGDAERVKTALMYLDHDLAMTEAAAVRMGIVEDIKAA